MDNPIFLVSTGRTGTKFFSEFFSDFYLGTDSFHTTKFTEFINILGNMYMIGYLPKKLMQIIWRLLKLKSIKSHQKRYIECNPYYTGIVDLINEDFTDARFVFIIRSPESYVISHMKKEKQKLKSRIANSILPYWQPVSYFQHLRSLVSDPYQRVDFYSRSWAIKNKWLFELNKKMGNSLIVRFEDIFNSFYGTERMNEMINWLDLKPGCPSLNVVLENKMNQSSLELDLNWDSRCDRIINRNCGYLISRFNY